MKTGDEIKIKVDNQGAVKVNRARFLRGGDGVVAFEIDLATKWPEIYFTGEDEGVVICFGVGESTLHLATGIEQTVNTTIVLPEFKGWDVWSYTIRKYTAYICLIK